MIQQQQPNSVGLSSTLTILNWNNPRRPCSIRLLLYSRRSYAYAIERFISWYCSEPRLMSIPIEKSPLYRLKIPPLEPHRWVRGQGTSRGFRPFLSSRYYQPGLTTILQPVTLAYSASRPPPILPRLSVRAAGRSQPT